MTGFTSDNITFENNQQSIRAYYNNGSSNYGSMLFKLPPGYTVEATMVGGQYNSYKLLNNANSATLKSGSAGSTTTVTYKNTNANDMELVLKVAVMQINSFKIKAENGNTVKLKNASNYYTLTFNKNCSDTVSGMPTNITNCLQGEAVYIPNSWPTRKYYEFYGWSTNPNATSCQYWPKGNINITSNTTLYAVWKEDKHKITIHPYANMKSSPNATWSSAVASIEFTYGKPIAFATTATNRADNAFIVQSSRIGANSSYTFTTDGSYSNGKMFRGWYIKDVDSIDNFRNGADRSSAHITTSRSSGQTTWTFDGNIDHDIEIIAQWGPVAYDYLDISASKDNVNNYIEYDVKGFRSEISIDHHLAPSWTNTNGQDDLIGGGAWYAYGHNKMQDLYFKLNLNSGINGINHGTWFTEGETYITHFYAYPSGYTAEQFIESNKQTQRAYWSYGWRNAEYRNGYLYMRDPYGNLLETVKVN